ncbi:MAG: hypothetical protein KME18_27585 [Phormidium tanganyikae FI6-MK23]|jgi:hypothetical protein|nr:hypothetical protein [Phormidium tanganyikae FI6-MK23]
MNDVLTATSWETIDLKAAWRSLDQSIAQLETPQQIQMVGRAIEHLVELFVASSEQRFEELDATLTQDGPQMTIKQFLPYVRQSMEIDFSQFVGGFDRETERGPYAPREFESEDLEDDRTIVAAVNPAKLADAVEGLEAEAVIDLEAALELAHIEDVEAWTKAISVYFEVADAETVSLQTLRQSIHLPWIEVWLGLLLGGYPLERRGTDFYGGEIWVRSQPSVSVTLACAKGTEPEC